MSEAKQVKGKNKQNRIVTTIKNYDWLLLLIVGVLMLFGIIMLYSTSSYSAQVKYSDDLYYVKKQLVSIVIGIVLMVVVSLFPREWLNKGALWAYGLGLALILLVKSSIGVESHGASRWISVGGMSFQPSEFVKIAVMLYTAYFICKYSLKEAERRAALRTKEKTSFTRSEARELEQLKKDVFKEEIIHLFISVAGASIAALMVIVFTDDLGTAIIIFAIGFVMTFVTTGHKYILLLFLLLIAVLAVVFIFTSDFRIDRIRAWLHPENYTTDEAYQITQGLYAIGSGGIMGKGLGLSTQKLDYLPESQNDMIFSIICEELGIIGGIILIILFVILIWKMKLVFDKTKTLFDKLIVIGVCTHVAVQAFINIAVVTSTIPNTGVPLPFISYGGSAIMMQLAEIGLVLGVNARNAESAEETIAFKNNNSKAKKRYEPSRAHR